MSCWCALEQVTTNFSHHVLIFVLKRHRLWQRWQLCALTEPADRFLFGHCRHKPEREAELTADPFPHTSPEKPFPPHYHKAALIWRLYTPIRFKNTLNPALRFSVALGIWMCVKQHGITHNMTVFIGPFHAYLHTDSRILQSWQASISVRALNKRWGLSSFVEIMKTHAYTSISPSVSEIQHTRPSATRPGGSSGQKHRFLSPLRLR